MTIYPTDIKLNNSKKFDLEERTALFAEKVIDFAKTLPETSVTKVLIIQFVKAGTSIGANYCEANECNSKKDFINKITIAKKESKETRYWLRLIAHSLPENKNEARILYKEAQELNLIFASIVRKSNKNNQ